MIRMTVVIPSLYAPERAASLYRCIESIYKSEWVNPKILLLLEGYPEELRHKLSPIVSLAVACPQRAFATARSMGWGAFAGKAWGDIVVHSDDDIVYEPSSLFEMYRVFHHLPNVGMVSPIGISLYDWGIKKKMDEKNEFVHREHLVMGCFAMRMSLYKHPQCGYCRKDMNNCDDTWLRFGTNRAGYEIVRASRAVVQHKRMDSSGFGLYQDRFQRYDEDAGRLLEDFGDMLKERLPFNGYRRYDPKPETFKTKKFVVLNSEVPHFAEDVKNLCPMCL